VSREGPFHLSLMAELNDAANRDEGPELEFFQGVIARGQGRALDAGCGAGRLLRRCLRAGLDVEGSDISPDMLAICRRRAQAEGLAPTLHLAATGELDLPARYRTVVMCGSLGLNGSRADDVAALAAAHRMLVEGGVLAFDVEAGWAISDAWVRCADPDRGQPTEWRAPRGTPVGDGVEIRTCSRLLMADPVAQQHVKEVRCERIQDGHVVQTEVHRLVERWYPISELTTMLADAGFSDISVTGDYGQTPVTAAHRMHVYTARRE